METYQEVDKQEQEVLETKLKEYQQELEKAVNLINEYTVIKIRLEGAIMATQELIDNS